MKFSTGAAVLATVIAVATGGCRYDKANDGKDGKDGLNGVSDMDSEVSSGLDNLQQIPLSDLANGGKSFKDRGYALCTDVNFEPVYFGFDATVIKPDQLGKVEAVARHLQENPDRVVSIEGNCDERGSNEYNLSLGEDRAIIISNFLSQNGISRDRMETISRGETNPAVEGTGEAVWSQNRRGEFVIWKK
jgi:peptidoglycan-associated lipoprotein